MTTALNIRHTLYRAPALISDPGSGGSITIDRDGGVCAVTTATAESRTLVAPTKAGIVGTVVLDVDGGDLTLTVAGGWNQAATSTITFGTAGDWVTFISVKVGSSYYWRVVGEEGTNAADTGVFGEATATNVNATNVNATLVAATNVNATNGTFSSTVNTAEALATNVNATNVTASSIVNAAELKGTNTNVTNVNATLVAATNVNATNVNAALIGTVNVNGLVVTSNTVGFFGGAAAGQPTGIANTNNNVDTLASTLNSVIAALETLGLIATI